MLLNGSRPCGQGQERQMFLGLLVLCHGLYSIEYLELWVWILPNEDTVGAYHVDSDESLVAIHVRS